jgi:VIT1/CCC1 family predicted Fe2+/Mn2+ transporter
MLGTSGFYAIALSIILTSVVLTVIASMIAVVTNADVKSRVAKTLFISLGAAAISILLGSFVRNTLKIQIPG